MSVLNDRAYRRLLEVIRVLNAPCGLEEFPARAIELASQLVASDYTAYNEVNVARGRIVAAIAPGSPPASAMAALLEPHLEQHPLVSPCAHGEITLGAISDYYDEKSWHRTALYNEFYRRFAIEDQLALRLNGEAASLIALTLHRSDRSFSRCDRELLGLLRPHLDNAHAAICALSEIKNESRCEQTNAVTARGYALVGAEATLIFCDSRARQLLHEFWNSDVLPDELRAWLLAARQVPASDPTFKARRADRVLNVRRGSETSDGTLLLFEESRPFDPIIRLQRLGLTARQSEVLWCLARGDGNAQIAARLYISLPTVKRHLEAIYLRLHVNSRAAAAHRALRALSDEKP